MIGSSPIAAVMSDPRLPDNPIVECNAAFVALTGYQREEIIGHNCRFLTGPGSEPWLIEMLRNGIRRRQPVMVEILNYKKDGTPFRNAVMVAPIFDEAGELEYFLGSQVEIAEDVARANDARREAAHARVTALSRRQREVLLLMAAVVGYILFFTSRAVSEVASPARSMSRPMPSIVLQAVSEPRMPANTRIERIRFNMMFLLVGIEAD